MRITHISALSATVVVVIGVLVYAYDWRTLLPATEEISKNTVTASQFVIVNTSAGQLVVARDETTVSQWQACVRDKACPTFAMEEKSPDHPMTGVNWRDVTAYLSWYSKRFDTAVRLPSREEWIVLAADHAPKEKKKLFDDPRLAWAADYDMTAIPQSRVTEPNGSFGSNQFGINDLAGNVWEWTASCQQEIPGLPVETFGCVSGRYAMGNHAAILSEGLRTPGNAGCGGAQPPANVGFRLVKN